MKREFCRQIFEKYSDIKFLESCLVGAESFHVDSWMDGWMDGWTGGHDKANSRLLQFCRFV